MPDAAADRERLGAASRLEAEGKLEAAAAAYESLAAEAASDETAQLALFHHASVLARLKRFDAAIEKLTSLAGAPRCALSRVAIALKLSAVRVRSGVRVLPPEVPAPVDQLEAMCAVDLASAYELVRELEVAVRFYSAAFKSGQLKQPSPDNVRDRITLIERRLAARDPSAELPDDNCTTKAVHAEIWACLQRGDPGCLEEAERLCGRLPGASESTAALVAHVLMSTAFELEQAGHIARAQVLYRRLRAEPYIDAGHRSNAAFRLGLTLALSGESEGSIASFEAAVNTDGAPEMQTAAALHLVHAWTQKHEYARAADVVDHVLALPSADAHARTILWFNRLFCQARLFALGRDDMQAASELPPAGSDVDAGVASAWVQAAFALEEAGRGGLSRLLYERLLSAPDLPPGMRANLHYRLGVVLETMFDYDGAAAQFRAAVETPDSFPAAQAEARHRLAGLHYMLDDFESALRDYEELRRLPALGAYQRAEAQLKYSTCLRRLNRLKEAEQELLLCREPQQGQGTAIEVQADLLLVELAESRRDWNAVRDSLNRVIRNSAAEPVTKAAALAKLQQVGRRR